MEHKEARRSLSTLSVLAAHTQSRWLWFCHLKAKTCTDTTYSYRKIVKNVKITQMYQFSKELQLTYRQKCVANFKTASNTLVIIRQFVLEIIKNKSGKVFYSRIHDKSKYQQAPDHTDVHLSWGLSHTVVQLCYQINQSRRYCEIHQPLELWEVVQSCGRNRSNYKHICKTHLKVGVQVII